MEPVGDIVAETTVTVIEISDLSEPLLGRTQDTEINCEQDKLAPDSSSL